MLPAQVGSSEVRWHHERPFVRVTTLRAKARSFSGYARPSGPRWRLRAQSEPTVLDQQCTDLIPRKREMTARAQMPALAQLLRNWFPADARLACAAWVHRDHPPAGSFRLAVENRDELAPRSVTNRLGQAMVLDHVLDLEILVTDHVEGLYKSARRLVVEVATDVRHMLVQARDAPPLFAPPFLPPPLFPPLF